MQAPHAGLIIDFVAQHPYAPPASPVEAPRGPGFARRLLRAFWSILQTLLFAGLLFLIVNLLTARIRVEGDSMEPSLYDGEFVVVNRLAYLLESPRRGDIIVFKFPLNPDRRFIKRVIGLPGDAVRVQEGQVFINGDPLAEPYIAARPAYNDEWRVGLDEVFVLGDNRNNSSDSQNWGSLPLDSIIGKAVLVYWPLDTIGLIPHYDMAVAADG